MTYSEILQLMADNIAKENQLMWKILCDKILSSQGIK